MTTLVAEATKKALEWHAGQTRKGGGAPYASHLLQVAGAVMEFGGTDEQVAAALLHDAIEDQDIPVGTIAGLFGDEVARIVVACTDTLPGDTADSKAPWRERKERYLAHLAEADAAVALVAACDKAHNLNDMVENLRLGLHDWSRFSVGPDEQRWFYCEVVEALRWNVPPVLHRRIERLADEFAVLTVA